MKLEDIIPTIRVIYIPPHAHGNPLHKDSGRGMVSSKNDKFAFVKYDEAVARFGWDGATSQATDPANLILEPGGPTEEQVNSALDEIDEIIEPWNDITAMQSMFRGIATLIATKNIQIETQAGLLHHKVREQLGRDAAFSCRHNHPVEYECSPDCLIPNIR